MTKFNAGPLTNEEIQKFTTDPQNSLPCYLEVSDLDRILVKDWAESMTEITKSVRALEYSLPDSDKETSERAYRTLVLNLASLGIYMKIRGLDI